MLGLGKCHAQVFANVFFAVNQNKNLINIKNEFKAFLGIIPGGLFLFIKGVFAMTKKQAQQYEPTSNLKYELQKLAGRKFKLDCGHHVTVGHNLANNITIYNGKDLTIICSLCGY